MSLCNLISAQMLAIYWVCISTCLVADSITITGGAAISRVRLLDEEEQVSEWWVASECECVCHQSDQ